MLIKSTNPNELLAEFERDKNFCPYNEEELERLKKEAERLIKDVTSSIGISHDGVHLGYNLSMIIDKKVCYEYERWGRICRISSEYSKKQTEYVRFEELGDIVFFYNFKGSDGKIDWTLDVTRTSDENKKVYLWIGEEVKFKKFGRF